MAKIALDSCTYLPISRRKETLEHLTRSRALPLAGPFDLLGSLLPRSYLLFTPPRGYLYPPPVIFHLLFRSSLIISTSCCFRRHALHWGVWTRSLIHFFLGWSIRYPHVWHMYIPWAPYCYLHYASVMLRSTQGWLPWPFPGERVQRTYENFDVIPSRPYTGSASVGHPPKLSQRFASSVVVAYHKCVDRGVSAILVLGIIVDT